MHRLLIQHRLLAALAFVAAALAPAGAEDPRPNFVVILIDDAGFTDLRAYGGEARTPTIDALAARGALFTRHHATPLCSPTRAMLLTGLDHHEAGVGTIPEVIPPEHVGKDGYALAFEPGVTTIAKRLQAAGYRTLMSGKWHLGSGPGDLPDSHGFDRSLALDASGADNWEDKSYIPYYRDAPWYEDGEPVDLPEDFYSSEYIVDKMMAYMDEGEGEPFFAFLPFQAVHIPVQAPREYTERYAGVYDGGWEALRTARRDRAAALGLTPPGTPLAPPHPAYRAWDDLSPEEKALYAKSMQVHAGMLEAMDVHIGRLVDRLKSEGRYENTVFIVTSDNGPEPSNPVADSFFRAWMPIGGYTHRLDDLGEKGSVGFIGAEWGNATASPGDLFKFYASEGGVRVPLVMAGPGVPEGARVDGFTIMSDLAPTIAEMAGLDTSAEDFTGRSLAPVLSGEAASVYGDDDPVGVEVSGNAALYRGDYKIVRNLEPWGDGAWRLFNIVADPGETRDLAAEAPDLFETMLADYAAYERRVGVLPMPEGYQSHKQLVENVKARFWKLYTVEILGVLAVLALVALAILFGAARLFAGLGRGR